MVEEKKMRPPPPPPPPLETRLIGTANARVCVRACAACRRRRRRGWTVDGGSERRIAKLVAGEKEGGFGRARTTCSVSATLLPARCGNSY